MCLCPPPRLVRSAFWLFENSEQRAQAEVDRAAGSLVPSIVIDG
jgi:hypothetical protein